MFSKKQGIWLIYGVLSISSILTIILLILNKAHIILRQEDIIFSLFSMAVIIVLILVTTRTQLFREILNKKLTPRNQFVYIMLFGIFAILATVLSFYFASYKINFRDLVSGFAGLVAGPVVGVLVGLIGTVHRIFMGGATAIPCAIACTISGLFAGLIYYFNDGDFIGLLPSIAFITLMEGLHMFLILVLTVPFTAGLEMVEGIAVPMLLSTIIGMFILGLMVKDETKKK